MPHMSSKNKRGNMTLSKKWLTGLLSLVYVAAFVVAAVQANAAPLPTVRINAGGDAYTDSQGRVWAADNYFTGGFTNSTTAAIAGTTDDPLYQTERWHYAPTGPEMTYAIPVPAGGYEVRLHFAEIYGFTSQPGARVFDVGIENKTVLSNFDIAAQAGANTALVKSFGAAVVDGTLNLRLMNGSANNPKISAIEVIGQDPLSVRVNAGGSAFTDGQSNVWAADNGFNTGGLNSTTAAIAGTTNDDLYQTERWDVADATPMQYSKTVPNGSYRVKLYFAEIYGLNFSVGARVFDVGIEGTTVLDDLDIYKEVGANTVLVKEFTTAVIDGQLNVNFAHGSANNPKISAIEVEKYVSSDAWPEYHIAGPGKKVDMLIVGDSYSAGNGASPDAGTTGYYFRSNDDPRLDANIRQKSTTLPDKGCFRHEKTWGQHAYLQSRAQYGNVGAFVNAACSGDNTDNLIATTMPLAQTNGFSAPHKQDVDLVGLTIGGNDLSFSNVVLQCFIADAGNACNTAATASESMLAPTAPGQYSQIQQKILAVLNKLKTDFPNAKIVLVGYPVFSEDKTTTLACSSCAGGTVNPGLRLENGINVLNLQQQQLVNDLNTTTPGRFAFMPLHLGNNTGFYDGHGIDGPGADWIHSHTSNPNVNEWYHPNAAGYAAVGDNLLQQPIVKTLFQ
jgi:lysophospholipase L1-like esterase